jgi:hypothetical protein
VVHLEEETQATEGAERGRWRRQLVIKGIAAGKGRGRVLTQRHTTASGEGPGAALGGGSGGPAPVVVRERRARPTVGRHNRGTREGGGSGCRGRYGLVIGPAAIGPKEQ